MIRSALKNISKELFIVRNFTKTVNHMGKNKQKSKGKTAGASSGKGKAAGDKTTEEADGPLKSVGSDVIIQILAKPGSSRNGITGISSEGVGVQIAAPPVDGEANTELVKYFSKLLGVRKSDVTLDKGSRSRNKVLIVSGSSKEKITDALQKELD